MSLFQSKVFWFCAVVCIAIVGFVGVRAYQSKPPLEPVIIYKATKPIPRVKSPEKPQHPPASVEQAEPPVHTVDSFEAEFTESDGSDADTPLSTSDGFEELTGGVFEATQHNEEKGKAVANFVGGIGLIAGGVAFLVSAPAVVTVSTVVSFGCLCYTAGYYITDKVLSSS